MYDNGYDFFKDLLCNYGKEEAIQIAKDYLDLSNRKGNKEEFCFCCELYQAMKQYENKQ